MRTGGTAQAIAYEKIREQIVTGNYPGGMKLIEERLAEEIGVSRTPVREAIRRLEQEGLVRRKKVFKPGTKELRDHFKMRILIEVHAAQMAATYMIDDHLEELKEAVRKAQAVRDDSAEIVRENKRFHDLIVRETRNPVMIDTVSRMQSIIYLFSRAVVINKRPGLLDEHAAICEAITERDPEKAGRLMEEHLEADLEFTLAIVELEE
ncbi:GntR family transcriptional regulator [Bhargavaea cecembensis]|uniref:GntR family transcriptional regulator n=1 Tax=Bhargavaea cecembensis TaxID=394098 RepID=A0A165H8V9_9BACL|nr:GntR family transcriptional regulator [Bhargavaea cecembensis]KZE39128.1 GntR family transcriptional regulator [Bhargavaea cecembensis]